MSKIKEGIKEIQEAEKNLAADLEKRVNKFADQIGGHQFQVIVNQTQDEDDVKRWQKESLEFHEKGILDRKPEPPKMVAQVQVSTIVVSE